MSKNIDRRLIVMEFDNTQFEREVKRSQSTLERLSEFLKFEKQAESLTGLSKAATGFDMSGMMTGVEAVSDRFSNLGIVGMTVIQELTKTALNFGKKLISGSIGQIFSGGKSRALNIEQAAFQFKGLGVDVEKAMNSANEAVLGTMYGFDQAAKAGSQMAASGVDVGDDMYKALRAVAGVAAMTGAEYEDMANIFTTVSGNGRLMGDQLNRIGARGLNAAAVLGEAMGISEGEVRDMVSNGEISFQMFADAMYEAFGDHATEASGLFSGSVAHVKAALSRIGGTFAPAIFDNFKVTLIELRYAIDAVHNALKPYLPLFEKVVSLIASKATAALTNFKDSFTNEDLAPYIDSMINIFKALISIAKPIGEAFRDIFPAMTLERFRSIGESIENFTSRLVLSGKNSENLKRTFRGLFAVLDIGRMIFTTIGKVILNAIGYFAPLGNSVLEVTGSFGDFLVSLRDVIAGSDTFEKVGLGIEKGFKPLKFVADTAIGLAKGVLGLLQPLAPMISNIGDVIGGSVEGITGRISELVQSLDVQQGLDLANTGIFGMLLLVVNKFMGALELAVLRGNVAQSFTLMMRKVRLALMEYQSYLRAKTLLAIAAAIAILVGSLALLASIDPERLGTAIVAMTALLAQLFASMAIFNKMLSGGGFTGIMKVALAMLPLAVSVLVLASAIKKLSGIEWEAMKTGLAGLAGSMILLVGSAKVLSSIEGKMMKGAGGMIVFAAALIVMATAVEKFGTMDGGILKQGLVGVGVMLTELALFMKVTNLSGMGVLKGAGILILAASMVVLSNAVSKFGEMDTNAMIQGLVGMGAVLTQIGIFMAVVKNPASMIVKANALLVLGAALLLFSNTIRQLGGMETGDLKQALIGLAAGLTIMVVALNLLRGAIGGAAAMLVMAGALAVLAPTLLILSKMELSELGIALLAIAGVFGVLAVAGLLLGPVTPIILALSAALLLLGAGVGLIGGGIALLATGLGSLAVAGTAGIATLTLLITSILGLIPTFLEQVARGILAFAKVIGEGAPALVEAVAKVIIALADAVIEASPKVAEAFVTLVWNVLDALEAVAPKLGESLIKIIGGLIEGMIQGVKDLLGISSPSSVFADIASDIIAGLVQGLKDGISDAVESIKEVGRGIVQGIKDFLGISSPSTVMAGVGGDVVLGLIKGIGSKFSSARAKAKELGQRILNGIKSLPGKLLKKGKEAAGDFVKGVGSKFREARTKASELGDKVKEGLKNLKADLETRGKEAISGFISGMGSKLSAVATAARGVASRALSAIKDRLNIASPSKVFRDEVGAMIALGVRDGIKIEAKKAEQAAVDMGKDVLTRTREYLDKKKYYNQISLEEELYVWQQAIKHLKYGSDERKAMDRELYRVRKEIKRKSFEDSKKWIDREKFYNRLSLAEELAAWQRVQARYKKGTEERKEADRQVYSLKKSLVEKQEALDNSYYENTKSINDKLKDDIKSLNDDYENAVESRAKTLAETWGLFDKVDKKDEVSGKDLVTNLEDQVEAFNEWEKEIHKLSGKGLNEELMKELENLGPNSVEEIKALNSLSNQELENYSNLWLTKFDNARKYAIGEMEDLRTETDDEIANLTKDADEQLAELESVWVTKTAELTGKVVVNFDQMKVDVGTSVTAMKTETVADFDDWVKDIKETVGEQDWESVGSNMIKGISKGITSNSKKLINQMKALATETINTVNDVLGIKSPSRAFAKIGAFAIQGFINGVDSLHNQASKSTSDVAKEAMDALKDELGRIDEAIDSDVDLSPVIRPVLDMDDVIEELNSSLGSRNIDVSAAQSRLSRFRRVSEIERQNGSKSTSELKQEVHYHAHLKAYGSLPKRVIDKMAKDFDASIKNLEDRRKMNRGEDVIF